MRNRQLYKFSNDPVNFNDANLLSVMHANTNHNIYWLLDLPKKIGEIDLSLVHLVVGYYKLKNNQNHRKLTVLMPSVNSQYQLAIEYEQNFINFASFKEEIKFQIDNIQNWENMSNNSSKNFVLADE